MLGEGGPVEAEVVALKGMVMELMAIGYIMLYGFFCGIINEIIDSGNGVLST